MAEFVAETLERELDSGIKELVNKNIIYFHREVQSLVQLELYKSPPPRRGNYNFLGGVGGSVRPENLKKCFKLYLNFQRGEWGSLDIFRN